MSKLKDITGQKFGRFTVLYKLHNYHKYGTYYLCLCECGNLREVRSQTLRNSKSKSCGCLMKELAHLKSTTHGKSDTKLYATYYDMKKRCYNEKHKDYNDYGGRGIKICDEWLDDFMAFYKWAIDNDYKENLTIDRIDVNGNYTPDNCRWATPKQQARNTRRNRMITINDETRCLAEWCEIFNLKYKIVKCRLCRGWSIEKALELR